MRTIYHIAKAELQVLFYSPIAWLMLILFTFQVGLDFGGNILNIADSQDFPGGRVSNITAMIFSAPREGFFPYILGYLYLYIPLLTMGLISREYTSGSIKMLYSSPVSNGQIVLGKFLAMMIFLLVLLGVLFLFVLISFFLIENMDVWAVLTGILGLYLVACTYAAIGLFMSALTSYQIVAALGTLTVLGLLQWIGGVGQDIPFVREITYWACISGRASEFIRGLICSEDVLYFIFVTAFFLFIATIYLKSQRQNMARWTVWGNYGGAVLLLLALGFVSSRPVFMCYYDATRLKVNTLTEESQKILAAVEGDLTLTAYANILGDNFWLASPFSVKDDEEVFKRYLRFKPEMKMEYVYYYDHSAVDPTVELYPDLEMKERAMRFIKDCDMKLNLFHSPEQMKSIRDLTGETDRLVREFRQENGRSTFLRVFDDFVGNPMEPEITAALKRLVSEMPVVGFVTGHRERDVYDRSDKGYNMFTTRKDQRYALINQGFDVMTLSLTEEVPATIRILVLAEPKEALSVVEMEHLKDYINRGGNVLLGVKPGTVSLMDELLTWLGVEVTPGVLVADRGEDIAPDVMIGKITDESLPCSYIFESMRQAWGYMLLEDCCGLRFVGNGDFSGMPFIVCDSVWNELKTTDYVDDKVLYNPAEGEHLDNYPVMLGLTREMENRQQKILVLGDADALSNSGILAQHGLPLESGNYQLMMGMFHWLSDHELPVDVRRPAPVDNKLFLGTSGALILDKSVTWAIPGLLLLVYLIIWIRRRGR